MIHPIRRTRLYFRSLRSRISAYRPLNRLLIILANERDPQFVPSLLFSIGMGMVASCLPTVLHFRLGVGVGIGVFGLISLAFRWRQSGRKGKHDDQG